MPQLSFKDALSYLARILPQIYISKGVKKKLVCIPYFVCILPSRGTIGHFSTVFRVSAQSQLLPISSVSATSHSALWQAAYIFLEQSSPADPGSGLLGQGLLGISHGASSTSSVELEDRVVSCLTHVSEEIPAFSQPPVLCSIEL